MKEKNILLLGVPRSGTTLACHLMNKLPNAVSLHEPLFPKDFFEKKSDEIISEIDKFLLSQRLSLLKNGTAISKTIGGMVPDNHLRTASIGDKKRVETVDGRTLFVNKNLANNFFLLIKHCSFFVAILEFLVGAYKCFAIVRNPLSTLLSWNSVELKVATGHAPAAELFDDSLEHMLLSQEDVHKRQILLLTWFYDKINECLPKENIIMYEDIVSSGGRVLGCIIPEASQLSEPLKCKNNNPLYDMELKRTLSKKLLNNTQGGFLHFYKKEDVLKILDER